MISEISNWEAEGGRIYKPMMRDTVTSIVHKRKPYSRPFFYIHEIVDTMTNNFIGKTKKSYDTRTALQRVLPTTVKG